MTFNKCSIAGQNYGEVIDKVTGEVIDDANKVSTNNIRCVYSLVFITFLHLLVYWPLISFFNFIQL